MADAPQRVIWPPRLVGALFDAGRPFQGTAYLALDSLTVLLGANGAGKSTTLRLLEAHLPKLASRPDPEHLAVEAASCDFFVELTDEQFFLLLADAHADQRDHSVGRDLPFQLTGTSSRPDGVAADPVAAALSRLEPASTTTATPAGVAEALGPSRILRVSGIPEGHEFAIDWCLSRSTAEELGLASESAQESGDQGPVPVASLGATSRTMLPTAVAVPRDLDDVRTELRKAVLDIMVHLRWGERDKWARVRSVPLDDGSARRGTQAWLKDPTAEVAAVDPDARALCALVSRLATTLAPSFVSEVHRVRVSIEPIYEWERGGPILQLELEREGGIRYPMAGAADGHKVWLQLATLEAVAILRRYLAVLEALLERPSDARENASAASRVAWKHYDAAFELLRAFRRPAKDGPLPPLDQFVALRNVGHRLYLIDEPEQHLHPRLQRSAARWLVDAGTAGASQCLVVTHSPHYLRIPGRVAFAYLQQAPTTAAGPRSVIRLLTPELLEATDDVAAEMGFDRGELLNAVSTILFVEGQADKLFLEAYAGAQLHHAGIALIPIHGAVSAERKGVVDSEVVLSWTAAKLAVLLDNLLEDEWRRLVADPEYRHEQSRKPAKTELKAMADILVRADQVGRPISPVGIPVDDIFDLLDEAVLKARFTVFPGHEEARTAHAAASNKQKINWKAFYDQAYGIKVEPGLFQEVGVEMAARGFRSSELDHLVACLLGLAETP